MAPPTISAAKVGVTYSTPDFSSGSVKVSPERIVAKIVSMEIEAVRLLDPNPEMIGAFASTTVSLFLSVPSPLVPMLASDRSHALEQDLVLPSQNWILHVDGSSTNKGSGAGVQLQSPIGELIRQSFSFGFTASNNEAEYESLIAGLRHAKAVKAKHLSAYCDSQLVTSQFSGDYDARNERMDAYLKVVQTLARDFKFFELTKVPRGENVCADVLAALGSRLHDLGHPQDRQAKHRAPA
ncbi:uncharacterized protein Mb2253c-like [Brassica napus]|uniref:uncharacterized protein Mb2253c-like n=1 Tax=Brassica napus TaxID=3708 RepID=UPI0020797FEE|nr:uncharacterized protein Mb2253c-like [Brassica napus]